MVNWKLLGVSGLFYLGSYGLNAAMDTNKGYDTLGYGLRGGDSAMHYVVDSLEPVSDLAQSIIHTNQMSYREPHLKRNQHKVASGLEIVAGVVQLASIFTGVVALFSRKRKRTTPSDQ